MNNNNASSSRRQVNFTMIPNVIIDSVKLRSSEFTVYVILLRHDYFSKHTGRRKYYVYPSLRTIKQKSCLSINKIYDALFVLSEAGLITIVPVNRKKKDGSESKLKRNHYLLHGGMVNLEVLNTKIEDARKKLRKRYKVRSSCENILSDSVPQADTMNVPTGGTEKEEYQKDELKTKKRHPPPPFSKGGCSRS